MGTGVRRRWVAATGLTAVAALALSGCLQDPDASGGGAGGGAQFAQGGTADGDGTVTILGAFGGGEQSAFEAELEKFSERTGIEVQYTSDKDLPTTIKQRADAGSTPDIALFPQPGGLIELAEDGHIQPIDTYIDYDEIERTLIPGFLEAARLNGRVYGVPTRMNVKSLVFYNKPAYTEAGYNTEPASLEELTEVADQIKADGTAPWCMGWADAQATGWVGTDWIEELVLRMWGPDVYDDWVSHNIPFNDDRIQQTFDTFRELMLADGQTFGNARGVLNTPFGESFNPAFAQNPSCYLHRQGNFILGFLPQNIVDDADNQVGLFVYPGSTEGAGGQPILGGGDIAGLFNGDDEEAQEVMKFLSSPEFGEVWVKEGAFLSPHKTFDPELYPDAISKQIAEISTEATVFRFDGSDLMPKEVGSDTFWKGMIDFANGASSAEVTTAIEESWPQ